MSTAQTRYNELVEERNTVQWELLHLEENEGANPYAIHQAETHLDVIDDLLDELAETLDAENAARIAYLQILMESE